MQAAMSWFITGIRMGSGHPRKERFVSMLAIVLVFTNSNWQLVYLDFKPKIWGQGNATVEYKVTTCE